MPVVVTMESDLDEGGGVLCRFVVMQLVVSMRWVTWSVHEQHMEADRRRGEGWQQPE